MPEITYFVDNDDDVDDEEDVKVPEEGDKVYLNSGLWAQVIIWDRVVLP